MSCEPRVKFPELRLASPWLDQGRGWRGRDDLSAMVAVQSCIHHCKTFVTPIRRVLPHPFIGNELHILANDAHPVRIELGTVPVRQDAVSDSAAKLCLGNTSKFGAPIKKQPPRAQNAPH